MSNISIETGSPTKGRVFFIGSMVNVTIAITPMNEIPNCYIPHNPSWTDLNRGKLSKRERRK